MKYLSTLMSTDWPVDEPKKNLLIRLLLLIVPIANPDYEAKMHLVKRWLIEFLEEDGELMPWREIALDANEKPIFAGPSKRNYGYWLDTNMKYEDFHGKEIDKIEFEKFWIESGVQEIKID